MSPSSNIEKLISVQDIDGLIKLFESKEHSVDAVKAIVKIGSSTLSYLIKALSHENSSVRFHACMAMQYLKDPRSVEPLTESLRDKDLGVHIGARTALVKIGKPSIEHLHSLLNDPDYKISKAAEWCLKKIEETEKLDLK